ncbi:hypothetical protein ACFLZ0_01145 [Patescibacteria group bacterium]
MESLKDKIIEFITKERFFLFSLFILILLSRLFFLGSSLWHDDAFHFVEKAVNLAVNGKYLNAHSTGYPFWIILLSLIIKVGHFFTGKWSIIFLPNLIIAIFGSLLLFPIYALSKKVLNNSYYSLLISITILINPIIWRWSEIAMSDIFALFFILCAIVFFIDFVEENKKKYLWLSNLFLYCTLMSRVLYGLVFLPFIIFWFISNKQYNYKKIIYIISNWLFTILLMIFTYGIFHDFNFLAFLSSYGSAIPTLKEIWLSSCIIFRTVGSPMFLISVLGLIFLFKRDKRYFYFLSIFLLIFILYLSSWYRNGLFDIERYSILLIVILLINAGYCLVVNKITRVLFFTFLVISLFLFAKGIYLPLNQYSSYVKADNYFIDYMVKASQFIQQTKVDGDLTTYQDLANYINDQDIIFYWKNDWIMPKLLLAGAHLQKKALLISIESKEDLIEKLDKYQNKKIYLLRGAYETYLEVMSDYRPVKNMVLGNRSIVYFIPSK